MAVKVLEYDSWKRFPQVCREDAMPWYARLMFFVLGLWLALHGWQQLHAGVFAYENMTYRQTGFSTGAIAVGLFMMAMAFLPSGQWIYNRISTRPKLLRAVRHLRKKHLSRQSKDESSSL